MKHAHPYTAKRALTAAQLAALEIVDPVGEALHFLRMSGTFYCRSEFTAPWGLEVPAMSDYLMFHVVTAGDCWLGVAGAPPQHLRQGDLALLPHGEGHRLASALNTPGVGLFDLPREWLGDRYEVIRHGGGGEATTLVCGAVRFDDPAAHHLMRLLPPAIVIGAAQLPHTGPHAGWMHSTLEFIDAEARELRAGGETIITRLADILVIQAIRSWIANDPAAQTGLLGALRDKQIGRAIALIHREPTRNWTVATLASQVAMSRSAFAARFTQLVGEPAMHYVTRWKMHTAALWLKQHESSLATIASRLGYESEGAFSRAFKRFTGHSPGKVRREARLQ